MCSRKEDHRYLWKLFPCTCELQSKLFSSLCGNEWFNGTLIALFDPLSWNLHSTVSLHCLIHARSHLGIHIVVVVQFGFYKGVKLDFTFPSLNMVLSFISSNFLNCLWH